MPYKSTRPGKHGPVPRPVAERFWEKVDRRGPDECWPWTAGMMPNGYGKFGEREGATTTAHRMAWLLARGPIPPGLVVCHRCDARSCCNPEHLWLGTPADNQGDMRAKGRHRYVLPRVRGEQHGRSKLRDVDVIDIRARVTWGYSVHEIASRYGVAPTTIYRIVRRELWTHLP